MGGVFILKCSRCKYKSIWEMWVAHRYREEHDTAKEISNGLWGRELQTLSRNREVRIKKEEVMFVCDSCREIDVRPSLSYKVRIRKTDYQQCLDNANIFRETMKRHMKEDYTEWIQYKHLCGNCNVQMREIYNPKEEGPILCPECGEVLRVSFLGVS